MELTKYEKIIRYLQYLDVREVYSEHRYAVLEGGDWADMLIEIVEVHRDLGHVALQDAR